MQASKPLFVCGTRAVVMLAPDWYKVVCATCGTGGAIRHGSKDSACSAAVRDSGRPCKSCGAR